MTRYALRRPVRHRHPWRIACRKFLHACEYTCDEFLRTTNDRLLEGGGMVLFGMDAALEWVFRSYWREPKSACKAYLDRHENVEIALVLLLFVPVFAFLYVAGVFVVAGEEVVSGVSRAMWWLRQPRRRLLTKEERNERWQRKKERDEGEALPKMRPRALTLMADDCSAIFKEESRSHGRSRVKQRTVDQLASCEFWKLPFEVREVIWKYAVGGNHVHVVKGRGRWTSVYCPAKDPTDPVHRDFCVRRDDAGFYVKSAWPRDMRPLALLVSCRQIYSESISFLYTHNTFAFDDPSLLSPFLTSLLPQRARLIANVHLAPRFAKEWHDVGRGKLTIATQPSIGKTMSHLNGALDTLARQPTLHSLSVTPKLRLDFRATGREAICDFVPIFLEALNDMKARSPIGLAWPGDPMQTSTFISGIQEYWGRDANLPEEEERTFELREIPYQYPTMLTAFFVPFDVQCLHCTCYTILRRATKGCAEVSVLPLSSSPAPPTEPSPSSVLTRYWTFHVACGGWIEFQYHGRRREWSVPQGARRVSREEADAHVAEMERSGKGYPAMENPHERLRGITVRSFMAKGAGRYSGTTWGGWGSAQVMDEPTKEAYYRNVGWGRDEDDAEGMKGECGS